MPSSLNFLSKYQKRLRCHSKKKKKNQNSRHCSVRTREEFLPTIYVKSEAWTCFCDSPAAPWLQGISQFLNCNSTACKIDTQLNLYINEDTRFVSEPSLLAWMLAFKYTELRPSQTVMHMWGGLCLLNLPYPHVLTWSPPLLHKKGTTWAEFLIKSFSFKLCMLQRISLAMAQ